MNSQVVRLWVAAIGLCLHAGAFGNTAPPMDGMIGWFRADLGVVQSGGLVSQWLDQSGSGAIGVTSSGINRPLFVANAINGRPAIRFDGVNDVMRNTGLTGAAAANLTIFLVANTFSNGGQYRGYLSFRQHDTNDYQTGFNLDLGVDPTASISRINIEGAKGGGGGGVDVLNTVHPFNKPLMFTVEYNPTVTRLRVDGRIEGTRSTSAAQALLDEFRIGARAYINAGLPHERGHIHADIAEVIVYRTALSAADIVATQSYLACRYDLSPLDADVNHDCLINADDIDAMYGLLGTVNAEFDYNGSGGPLDQADVDHLVRNLMGTQYGDANLDRRVNITDLSTVAVNFGAEGGWAKGNFNGRDGVTITDLSILATNFGFVGAGAGGGATLPNAVPEPAVVSLMLLSLTAWRRRSRS